MMLRPLCLILAGILLLPSCGLFKKKLKSAPTNPNIRLSGRVKSVNKDAQFVLIRRYGAWKVGDGQVVESRGEGRTANLMPTGERLGEHVAADIRSGKVEVGDGVYIRTLVKKTAEIPVEDTDNSAKLKKVAITTPEPVLRISPPAPTAVKPIPTPLPPLPKVKEDQL